MARPRSPVKALTRLLTAAREPIAVFDGKRTLVYCNSACAAWLGFEAESVIGRVAHFHSDETEPTTDSALAALCPPPESFDGRSMSGIVTSRVAELASFRHAVFSPLTNDDANAAGVVVIVSDREPPRADDLASEAESRQLHEALQQFRLSLAGAHRLAHIIGDHPAIRRAREQMRLAMQSTTSVVVSGPPGSGREHIARTIHYGDDPPLAGPLVPLTCSLLNPELLQTTVMALARRCADLKDKRPGGLLLLEVDSLTAESQAELVGLLTLPTFHLHTIATSREPLRTQAEAGRFDTELAMRLSTLTIELPPLAQRRHDIPLLAQHFLEQWNSEGGRQLSGFTTDAFDALSDYSWPNNLDELREFVREACERATGTHVMPAHLPKRIHLADSATARPPKKEEAIVLDELLADMEAELIRRALTRAGGNKAKAARLLGISRPRLLRRIEQLKILESQP